VALKLETFLAHKAQSSTRPGNRALEGQVGNTRVPPNDDFGDGP
jgi:hypothetical protein